MKLLVTALLILAAAGPLAAASAKAKAAPGAKAAPARNVVSARQRAEILQRATELLVPKTPALHESSAGVPDPFYRSNFVRSPKDTVAAPDAEAPVADMGTLERVAAQIRPTGTILIGSEPYLLIDGRRYKVGDVITIAFEGLVYQVAISSIERNLYTLRLNDNELRREFK